MSDPIFFGNADPRVSIYLRYLIAFYPDEGFLIFEGYNNTDKSHPPYTLRFLRTDSATNRRAYYEVTVTDTHIKYPGGDPFNQNVDIDRMCTYSHDIIIIKFKVDLADTPATQQDWRYCVDSRFKSPRELLTAYMGLIEMPEDHWCTFRLTQDDTEFYKGYQEIREKNQKKIWSD
jgi:hypothetical protein